MSWLIPVISSISKAVLEDSNRGEVVSILRSKEFAVVEVLPAASVNLVEATEIRPLAVLSAVGVNVAV